MEQTIFDSLIIGPVSKDIMIDCEDNRTELDGGAVLQSGYAAANTGYNTAVFTKLNPADMDVEKAFSGCPAKVFWKESKATTSILNKYFTPDKEKRACNKLAACDPFSADELPQIEAKIYHFAGLMVGDFDEAMFETLAGRAKIAVDVQCLLRKAMHDGSMEFFDWDNKHKYLPFIDLLKTDAAEAQILTGLEDRQEAAKCLRDWGAKEVMITHNTEVLVYDGIEMYTCPIKARSLVGRTGRGDTTFAGYINTRLYEDIPDALRFATALVSLKMETPGPFKGEREDVMTYMKEFYS